MMCGAGRDGKVRPARSVKHRRSITTSLGLEPLKRKGKSRYARTRTSTFWAGNRIAACSLGQPAPCYSLLSDLHSPSSLSLLPDSSPKPTVPCRIYPPLFPAAVDPLKLSAEKHSLLCNTHAPPHPPPTSPTPPLRPSPPPGRPLSLPPASALTSSRQSVSSSAQVRKVAVPSLPPAQPHVFSCRFPPPENVTRGSE
ncbi:hypothetical protein O3P69_017173 [Scylla paramamosain]|uniref:Uncharacterized protein n=1 Tax=Scylla paramamosain TaxID=85552 RepID=A0AAW0TVP8_SCYPA